MLRPLWQGICCVRKQHYILRVSIGSGILVIGAENTGSQLDAMAAMIATQAFLLSLSLMEQVQNLEEPSHPLAEERRQHLLRELLSFA